MFNNRYLVVVIISECKDTANNPYFCIFLVLYLLI